MYISAVPKEWNKPINILSLKGIRVKCYIHKYFYEIAKMVMVLI